MKHAQREDVQEALDKLIQRQQVRLVRDEYDPATDEWHPGGQWETHTIPSLWEQLSAASAWKAQGATTGSSFGSRPVISAGAVALRLRIYNEAARAAAEHSNPSPVQRYEDIRAEANRARQTADLAYMAWKAVDDDEPLEPDFDTATDVAIAAYWTVAAAWQAEYDAAWNAFAATDQQAIAAEDRADAKAATLVPDNLRAIAANITTPDDIAFWVDHLAGWASEVQAALALAPEYPSSIRGQACPNPECQATTATVTHDSEPVRVAALSIIWTAAEPDRDQQVRAIQCRACGHATFRGTDLNDLALQWMTEPRRARDPIAVHPSSNMAPGIRRPEQLPDTA